MKIYCSLIVFLFCLLQCVKGWAQNLVPNPSFEDHYNCLQGYSNIVYDTNYANFVTVDKWVIVSGDGTSDYYNTCNPGPQTSVPNNYVGHQWPRTGDAYVGIYASTFRTPTTSAIYPSNFDYREHVQARLTDSMKVGHKYYVSYYVALSNLMTQSLLSGNVIEGFQVGLDKMGMLFTDTIVHYPSNFPVDGSVAASITNPAGRYLTDTLNWTKVQGVYTATGNHQWITLGYFEPHNQMKYQLVYVTGTAMDTIYPKKCYMLIDDVCVVDMANATTGKTEQIACTLPTIIDVPRTGSMYRWNTGDTTAQLTINAAGTYYRETWGECLYYIDTIHTTAQPAHTSGINVGCIGDSSTYAWIAPAAGDTTQYTSAWFNTAGTQIHSNNYQGTGDTVKSLLPGTYTVLVHSFYCDVTIAINIPQPTYKASFIGDTILCEGQVANFHNTSTTDMVSWLWQFGDGNGTTLEDAEYAFTTPGTYRVVLVAATATPCYDSMSMTVVVDPLPSVSFTTSKNTVCESEAITFTPQYSTGIDTLVWNFGDGTASEINLQPTHLFNGTGTRVISVTAQSRVCPDTIFRDTAEVVPYPMVNLGPDTSLCPNQPPIALINRDDNIGDLVMRWNTGDIGKEILVNIPGIYWLTVDNRGCTTTDSILVARDCYISIPNAFTPNGDGVNDYFFPKDVLASGVKSFTMAIYNRWGQTVFETNNINGRGWDGMFNGSAQQDGVYTYFIDVTFTNNVTQRYQGNITLLR